MVKLLTFFLISTLSFGQDFAKFGQATQVDAPGSNPTHKSKTKKAAITKPAPKECSAKDQVSLPKQDILALMIYKNKSINASSSLGGDYLNVELDSPIIGNCSSMLEPKLTYSAKHSKYLYEVKIRKVCDQPKCEYEVSTLEDGEKKVSNKSYTPTLTGFYKCMQDNVGLNEEKTAWNKSSIVKKELSKASVSSPVTSNLIMVSRGPVGMQNSDVKNLIVNNDCDYFENINDSGFKHYSSDDLKYMNLEKAAQKLCKSGDYLDIESSLSQFASEGNLYQSMIKVRDQLLLDDIKAERAHLQNLKKDKDLSSLDSAKYKKLSEDFYRLIIDKNMSTENHTVADQQNPELLVNMRAEYQKAYSEGNYDYAKIIAAKIEKKVNELAKYMVAPYFDVTDYKAMSNLALKPEIESSDWKEATKNVHKSIMTLKLLCEAYGSSKTCEENKTSNQNFKKKSQLTMIEAVAKRTNEYNKKAMDNYDEKAALVINPKAYKSLKYVKLLNECKQHKETAEQYAKGISSQMPAITQSCQQSGGGNPQQTQACIDQYKYQISGDATSFKLKLDNCKSMNKHYVSQKDKWETLEAQRDDYIGFSDADKKKRKSKVDKAMKEDKEKIKYTYKYKGITQSQNNTARTNPYIRNNMNTGLNINTGFNTNFNNRSSMYNPYSSNNYSMFSNNGYNNGYHNQNSFNPYMNSGYMSNSYNPYMNSGYNQNYRSPSMYNSNMGLNLNFGVNGNYGQQQQNPYAGYMNNNSGYYNQGTQYNNGFNFLNTGASTVTNPGTNTNQSGGFMFDFN